MGCQQHWSLTPDDNATADGSVNWREGQSPSTVNDSNRTVMARVKAFIKDISGSILTTGGSTAYVIATNEVFTALSDGLLVAARMHLTNGAAPTLNVDATGAKAIEVPLGTACPTGKLVAGALHLFCYNLGSDRWVVHGVVSPAESDLVALPATTRCLFMNAAVPAGWTQVTTWNNHTMRLSSAANGGTEAGSVDFTTLFGRTGTDSVILVGGNIPSSALTYQRPTLTFGTTVSPAGATPVGTSISETPTALAGANGDAFTPQIDMRVKHVLTIIGARN
jgi:hypothetical protein